MNKLPPFLLIASLLILFIDFVTLGNQSLPYYRDPILGPLGSAIGVVALIGIVVGFLVTFFLGIKRLIRGNPSSQFPPPTPRQKIYRRIKVTVAVLALLFAFFGLPLLFMKGIASVAFDSKISLENLFLNYFALGIQLIVPTPFALVFWPFTAAAIFLIFSRKIHYVLDTLAFLVLIASTVGIWTVFVKFSF